MKLNEASLEEEYQKLEASMSKEELEAAAWSKIKKSILWLYYNHKFYARILTELGIWLNWELDYKTAATDYNNIYFDPRFALTLSDSQLRFVLVHEILHIVLSHNYSRGDRNPTKWNAAADFALNDLIVLDPQYSNGRGFSMPKLDGEQIGLWDKKYRGMTAVDIYDKLGPEYSIPPIPPIPPPPKGGGGPGGGKPGTGEGEDEDSENKKPKGGGPGGGGSPVFRDLDTNVNKEGAIKVFGSDEKPREVNPGVFKQKMQDTLKSALAGSDSVLGANLADLFKNIFLPEPIIDWREELEEFFKKLIPSRVYVDITRRSLARGEYLDGHERNTKKGKLDEVVIAIDNSGSISKDEIKIFVIEVLQIMEIVDIEWITILYVDTEIHENEDVDQFKGNESPDFNKIHAGGGTDFRPPFDWIEKEGIIPDVFIYFTDGHASPVSEDYKGISKYSDRVFWLYSTPEKDLRSISKFGTNIWINVEDFKESLK